MHSCTIYNCFVFLSYFYYKTSLKDSLEICIARGIVKKLIWFFYWNIVYLCCCCYSVAKSCPTLSDSTDCSLPGSSVQGVSQARILQWVAISSPGELPDPGINPHLLCLLHWQADSVTTSATWEAFWFMPFMPFSDVQHSDSSFCRSYSIIGYYKIWGIILGAI